MKCEVFGCNELFYNSLSIGPGTSTTLCEVHFIEVKNELLPEYPKQGGEDMVKPNKEKGGVLEVRLTGVDIPKAGFLADLLQEWVVWVKTYGSLIGTDDEIVSLYQRSREAVKKWGRDG